jgi:hypothetical protein
VFQAFLARALVTSGALSWLTASRAHLIASRVQTEAKKQTPKKQKALLRFRVQRFFSLLSIPPKFPPSFYAGFAECT